MKSKMKTLKEKLAKFFMKKTNIIVVSIITLALLILVVYFLFFLNEEDKKKFALSSIYDVYPEEVRELYTNLVSISCKGDLYLPIELDAEATEAVDLEKTTLLDLVFSYLDKNDMLDDGIIHKNVFENAVKKLIAEDIELIEEINEYPYDKYIYTYDKRNKEIKRKSNEECIGEKDYYSQLFGYSYSEKTLSIDINIGYKDGVNLYNLAGEKLGKFEDETNAYKLFSANSYYRYNFVKENGQYKLKSVQWMNRV